MPIYELSAKDSLGNSKSGTVEAKSQIDALSILKSQALIVVSIAEKHASLIDTLSSLGGVSFEEVTEFSREFSTMINSGLTITKSLQICTEQTTNNTFKKILNDIVFINGRSRTCQPLWLGDDCSKNSICLRLVAW